MCVFVYEWFFLLSCPQANPGVSWLNQSCIVWMSVPKCDLCLRPGFIFGRRDRVTGWEGWCEICNWRWRYHLVSTLTEFRIFNSMRIYDEIRWRIVEFLIGSELTHFWKTGAAQCSLREIQIRALHNVWRRVLFGFFCILAQVHNKKK